VEQAAEMTWQVVTVPKHYAHKLHAFKAWALHRGSQLQALSILTSGKEPMDQFNGRMERRKVVFLLGIETPLTVYTRIMPKFVVQAFGGAYPITTSVQPLPFTYFEPPP
jgi:hypothetical protein